MSNTWSDGSFPDLGRVASSGFTVRRPVEHVVIVRDLTERKRAQEALQRSEREFRELAESMPQIVWATRADGWNIYFNQQWVDYTGLTLEESYGEGWITPFHPDDRQRAWDAWQRATQHRDTYSLECRLRRADGVYRWWLIRGVPLLGANGEITQMVRHLHRYRTDQSRGTAASRNQRRSFPGSFRFLPMPSSPSMTSSESPYSIMERSGSLVTRRRRSSGLRSSI